MGYTWGMVERKNQERIWVAATLHRRLKAMKKRTGTPMIELANRLIRRGLQEFRDDESKARRDGRGSER